MSYFRETAGYARTALLSSVAHPGDLVGLAVRSGTLLLLFLLTSGNGAREPEPRLDAPIHYFLFANVFFVACMVTPRGQFAGAIRNGLFTLYDAMPSHIVCRSLGTFLGERLLPTCLAATALVAVISVDPASLPASWWIVRLSLMLIMLPVCAVVVCLFDMIVSYLAFLSPLHQGVGELKSGVYVLTSGILFPITIMPGPIGTAAYLTPFPWAIYEPARLLSQSSTPELFETLSAIGSLTLWSAGLAITVTLIERLRLREGITFES